eukprot:GFYU01002559.1.p1 GENE.GFYU01002559.1~~GFYU01002559.1.p1  ORF type:complete len:110 (-),score=28.75 GFYU01002559.1:70-357(-)
MYYMIKGAVHRRDYGMMDYLTGVYREQDWGEPVNESDDEVLMLPLDMWITQQLLLVGEFQRAYNMSQTLDDTDPRAARLVRLADIAWRRSKWVEK